VVSETPSPESRSFSSGEALKALSDRERIAPEFSRIADELIERYPDQRGQRGSVAFYKELALAALRQGQSPNANMLFHAARRRGSVSSAKQGLAEALRAVSSLLPRVGDGAVPEEFQVEVSSLFTRMFERSMQVASAQFEQERAAERRLREQAAGEAADARLREAQMRQLSEQLQGDNDQLTQRTQALQIELDAQIQRNTVLGTQMASVRQELDRAQQQGAANERRAQAAAHAAETRWREAMQDHGEQLAARDRQHAQSLGETEAKHNRALAEARAETERERGRAEALREQLRAAGEATAVLRERTELLQAQAAAAEQREHAAGEALQRAQDTVQLQSEQLRAQTERAQIAVEQLSALRVQIALASRWPAVLSEVAQLPLGILQDVASALAEDSRQRTEAALADLRKALSSGH
jgi:regulator of protease activity HflC (stomatin/prohibitin superfamily)